MMEEEKVVQILHGRVKWFDPTKGFGFIVSEETPRDILLHANVLRNFGQSSVADGTVITVKAHQTPRGVQAVEVLSIEPQATIAFLPGEDQAPPTPEEIAASPLEPARVKWFDKSKGFGFANVFGKAEDVFVHVEVLRQSGLADLQTGEAVALRIVSGKRGRMAIQVCSWETAARSQD